MDADTFIVHVKFEYVSEEVAGDFERRVYTCNFEVKRPLAIGQN